VIQTDGSTSLTEVAQNYFLYNGGIGPELQFGGTAVTAGEFGAWAPIGAVQITGGGYEVVWSLPGGNQYSIWTTDSSGHFVSQVTGLTGTSAALESLETTFHQDLNGDGVIGAAATIATGATLELTSASSVSVTFGAATGILVLDHSTQFTGKLINLTGDGNPSSSDQIDLRDIAFGSGTTYSYAGNTSGGVLTISDTKGDVAHISLVGNYTNSTFTLSSDGHGGTLAIDPPKNDIPANAPTTPPVTSVTANNDGFVFHQAASGASANLNSVAFDGLGSKTEHTNLIAFANEAEHQWTDSGHDSGLGYIHGMNTHFADVHASHFIIH
jgi:hypothetical protein